MATLLVSAASALKGIGLASSLQLGGTILSGVGAIKAGNDANAAAQYNAAQLDAAAKTENATAQRQAEEDRRQKEITISRARAVGARFEGKQAKSAGAWKAASTILSGGSSFMEKYG